MDSNNNSNSEVRSISFAPYHGFRRRGIAGGGPDASTLPTIPGELHIGYIYLLRTREHRLLGRPYYKVGRTTQEPNTRIRRLEEYTKGSEVICLESCPADRIIEVEREVLREFRHTFETGPDGSEDYVLDSKDQLWKARDLIIHIVRQF